MNNTVAEIIKLKDRREEFRSRQMSHVEIDGVSKRLFTPKEFILP